jgi:nitrogen fixation/metabolism regulation signal transduction histidine kinase
MKLRTGIFRRLVLVALIPAILVAAAAYYFLSKAMEQSGAWIEISSPDRTINSLRLTETRLQETALKLLSLSGASANSGIDSLLDWRLTFENGRLTEFFENVDLSHEVDSLLREGPYESGIVRRVAGGNLIIGACVEQNGQTVVGGFILGREYLSGFEAASATLQESRRYRNLMPGLMLFMLAAGATVLVLIIAGAWVLSRRLSASVTTPLEQLTAVTAAVSRGDTPEAISITGTEEISRLTETFNRMIADLTESRQRLMAAERVAAWQEFARRMAHELKNPLTPISISLYRIKKSLEADGQYDRFAESIEAIAAEVAHLERLATEYASLSKLPEPKIGEFEIIGLVQDILNLYAPQLENFDFEAVLPEEPAVVEADSDHLRQVMVNLIKNAIEFTRPRKKIIISITVGASEVDFMAANESENVSEADLKSARIPYFSTRQGGTGLGLAISEKIIIDHGGSLRLESSGGMTIAGFKIPRRRIMNKGR